MKKVEIDPYDYAGHIARQLLHGGVALATRADGCTDAMTIGWGHIGNEWAIPSFVAYVRTGRFTTELLRANPEFTICVPLPAGQAGAGEAGAGGGADRAGAEEAGAGAGADRAGAVTGGAGKGRPATASAEARRLLGYLGTHSGRDTDKVAGSGLTLVEPMEVAAPAIAELPLTLECRVIYQQEQDVASMGPALKKNYPADVPSSNWGANRDPHVAYWGQIVAAYIVEE